jgi:hypothetical protein
VGIKPSRGSQSLFLLQEADTTHEWGVEEVSSFLSCRSKVISIGKTVPSIVAITVTDEPVKRDPLETVAVTVAGGFENAELHSLIEAHEGTRQDAAVANYASPHGYRLAFGVGRDATQAIFTPVLENQRNGVDQAGARFLFGAALTVRAWNLWTVGHMPFAVALEHSGKLVVHTTLAVTLPSSRADV